MGSIWNEVLIHLGRLTLSHYLSLFTWQAGVSGVPPVIWPCLEGGGWGPRGHMESHPFLHVRGVCCSGPPRGYHMALTYLRSLVFYNQSRGDWGARTSGHSILCGSHPHLECRNLDFCTRKCTPDVASLWSSISRA